MSGLRAGGRGAGLVGRVGFGLGGRRAAEDDRAAKRAGGGAPARAGSPTGRPRATGAGGEVRR
jgi:hypothetical protein